jgi:mannosyltransferase
LTGSSPGWALPHRRAELAVVVLIVLLATALRLYQLNTDSLWGDEIHEARTVEQGLASTLTSDPLGIRLAVAYVFMQVGRQDLVFRFPYAIMGILGVAAMYRVGRTIFDSTTAVIGSFLLAVSSFHIQYSQEARSYSLTVLLVLTSLYCLYRAVQDNQLKHWAGFAISTALSLANHPTSASVVASEIAWAVLVLLGERFTRTGDRQDSQAQNRQRSRRWQDRLNGWLRRIRSSRGVMLACSSLAGVLQALVFGKHWLSYLSAIGISTSGPKNAGDYVAMSISRSYLGDLLAGFGAGGGVALVLFGGAFAAGLVFCAVRRQLRQMLLAPIWILPPFLIVPRITADVPFMAKHLIFILPVYLLFVARGIAGMSELVSRYVGRSPRTRRLAWGVTLALVLGTVSWLSVKPVQAYYREQKLDWRGAVALLQGQVEPGELIFQLMPWPWEAVPYYLEGSPRKVDIEVVNIDTPSERELPVDVWWVLRTLRPPTELELNIGPEFDVHPLSSVAVVHRNSPVSDPADFWQLTTRLLVIQAQYSTWQELDWYRERLARAYNSPLQPPAPLPDCLPGPSDPADYVQTLREQIQNGQRLRAFDTVGKMRILHEALYPPGGEVNHSTVQALRSLGGSALASGDRSCALELYSRAADGLLLAVESDPGDVDGWRELANVLVEAERYPEAIMAYRRLIELVPDHTRYRIRLARAYRADGQVDEAIAVLERAIDLAPGEWRPPLELGNTYLLLERTDEAAVAFQRVLEVDAAIAEAHFGLALVYDAQGQKALADQEYQTVIEIDPEHWLARQAEEKLAEPNQ